jgi:hypothetical protein
VAIRELFTAYYESLEDSRKWLLSRYRFIDVAHKVVGVGSVVHIVVDRHR